MLCNIKIEREPMPRGNSGRVVIELDPDIKSQLYQALKGEKLTLKEWFLLRTREYLDRNDPQLVLELQDTAPSQEGSEK